MLVGRRMTRDPKTVAPDDSLTHAADVMRQYRFNHLPVVEGGKLVGIVSDTDLRNVSLASDRPSGPEAPGPAARKVREVMKTEVWSLTPDDAVEDALLIIQRKKFGALPVLEGDRLVGIITKLDMINTFIDVLDIDDVGLRVEVLLHRSMERFEELVDTVREAGVDGGSAAPRHGQRSDGPGSAPGEEVRGPGTYRGNPLDRHFVLRPASRRST